MIPDIAKIAPILFLVIVVFPLSSIAQVPTHELMETRLAEIGLPATGAIAENPPTARLVIAAPDNGCPKEWGDVCALWLSELLRYPRYAAYLQWHPLLFKFVEPVWFGNKKETWFGNEGQVNATWEEDGIYLNAAMLRKAAKHLRQQRVDPDIAPRILALKMLPLIAHELEHGITFEALRLATGIRFLAGSQEDEYLATRGSAEVLADLEKNSPELFTFRAYMVESDFKHKEILSRWHDGPKSLFHLVQRTYKNSVSILAGNREDLLGVYRKNESVLRRHLLHYSVANAPEAEIPLEVVERWHQKTSMILVCLEEEAKFNAVRSFLMTQLQATGLSDRLIGGLEDLPQEIPGTKPLEENPSW